MAEEKIPGIMRDFVKTMEKGDVDKMLSFLTDDAVWVNPNGTFRGKEELKRYLTVMFQNTQDMTVTECGNGIIVEGNKAFFEHVIGGTVGGRRAEVLAMCAYEFSGDKIKEVRTTYDRLLMAQQAATGLGKWMVNMIVKQAEKGLH
ncbi:MAG: nuclear transport factor 2 family protein [Dehalococcoidales bacterium]